MEKNNLLGRIDLLIVLIVYSALAIFSLFYHHYLMGADGISYLSIAIKYFNGDWSNAINGYWSPLYSWLMIPFISFGNEIFNAVYVTRIVSFIAGFLTIIGLSKLSAAFNLDKSVERVLLVTSIPMILFYSIFYDTPDVLVVCFLVFYFSIIFKDNYSYNWFNGVLCGLLGAFAFFSKTYIFPFFLVHFLFFNILFYFKGMKIDRKGIKRNLIIGLVVFLTVSSLWIGALSIKYDKLTIGTTSEYNHAITGPGYDNHPVYFMGLLKPPNPGATSIWEEPSTLKLNDWSPLKSWENFNHQLKIIQNSLSRIVIILEYYSILSIIIILISLFLIFKSGSNKSFKMKLIYILLTLLIYASGYITIHIQERYLWPMIILIMFTGFYLVNTAYQNKNINLRLKNIFLIIMMISFIFAPTYEIFIYPHTDNDSHLISILKDKYHIQGNIASNNNWEQTNRLSFYLNSQYYGLPKNINNSIELEKELKANNIVYYFVWGDSGNIKLIDYEEITNGRIKGLKIYKRK